jgi:O-antigen/teichoic acid export membrane protein
MGVINIVVDAGRDPKAAVGRIRRDPLARNSFFLMATTVLTGGLGFLFWLIVAHLYQVEAVGRATSLLSALSLLSYLSLLGMGGSLVRHLPTTRERPEHVSSALITVGAAGLVVALVFAIVVRFTTPDLAFVSDSPLHLAIFVVLAACAALNLLSNSVFIALRAARYNLLVNGVLMGLAKIALPFLFVWGGAMGIYAASGLASLLAACASVRLISAKLRIRIRWADFRLGVIRRTFRYSAPYYAINCLNLVPLLIIPILVLDRLGPTVAAGYFMAFQIATVINSVSFAVGETLFAEGAHQQEHIGALMRRSAAIIAAVTGPAVLIVVLLAGPVLAIFGPEYVSIARGTLVVLAVSSFAVAFHVWTGFLLKMVDQLAAAVWVEVVFAVATTVLAVLAAPHGPVWIGAAWGVGNLVSAAVAAVAFLVSRRARSVVVRRAAAVPSEDDL